MQRDNPDQLIEQAITRKGEQQSLKAMARMDSVEALRQIMHTAERKHRPIWLRKQVWAFTSAVAVIAVVLIIGLQPRYSSQELYARWSEKVAYESAVARGTDEAQIAFESALALAQEGKIAESIAKFTLIAAATHSEYAEDARWYLAMAYLHTGERSRAKELLSKIAKKQGFYAIEANELFHELNTRRWF